MVTTDTVVLRVKPGSGVGHVGTAHRDQGQQGTARDRRSSQLGSHIGQVLLGEEITGVDFGEDWISIEPGANYERTKAKIEDVVSGYPRMFTNVGTYLAERISEVIS